MNNHNNEGAGALLVIFLVIGVPYYLTDCAGRPYSLTELRVSAKHFRSGKHACYELTLQASDGETTTYCAQPEEYAATAVGDRVMVNAMRGRVSKWLFVESDSLQNKMPAEHERPRAEEPK